MWWFGKGCNNFCTENAQQQKKHKNSPDKTIIQYTSCEEEKQIFVCVEIDITQWTSSQAPIYAPSPKLSPTDSLADGGEV